MSYSDKVSEELVVKGCEHDEFWALIDSKINRVWKDNAFEDKKVRTYRCVECDAESKIYG